MKTLLIVSVFILSIIYIRHLNEEGWQRCMSKYNNYEVCFEVLK